MMAIGTRKQEYQQVKRRLVVEPQGNALPSTDATMQVDQWASGDMPVRTYPNIPHWIPITVAKPPRK